MTKTIEIFLLGLMVLVPLPDSKGMQTLLVKSSNHTPTLAFDLPAAQCMEQGAGWCTPAAGDLCLCDITDVDLSFYPLTEEETGSLLSKPDQELPSGSASGQQPEWLVRMANIDEVKTSTLKDWSLIKGYVSAKASFGWSRAQNCTFDALNSRVHNFEFVNPMTHQRVSHYQQALSEAIVFDSQVQLSTTNNYYDLMLARSDGTKIQVRRDCTEGCPPLLIANVPDVDNDQSDPYGEHFALYADLFQGSKGLIPHRLATSLGTVAAGEVQSTRCKFSKFFEEFLDQRKASAAATDQALVPFFKSIQSTINGPVVCPMALADPR